MSDTMPTNTKHLTNLPKQFQAQQQHQSHQPQTQQPQYHSTSASSTAAFEQSALAQVLKLSGISSTSTKGRSTSIKQSPQSTSHQQQHHQQHQSQQHPPLNQSQSHQQAQHSTNLSLSLASFYTSPALNNSSNPSASIQNMLQQQQHHAHQNHQFPHSSIQQQQQQQQHQLQHQQMQTPQNQKQLNSNRSGIGFDGSQQHTTQTHNLSSSSSSSLHHHHSYLQAQVAGYFKDTQQQQQQSSQQPHSPVSTSVPSQTSTTHNAHQQGSTTSTSAAQLSVIQFNISQKLKNSKPRGFQPAANNTSNNIQNSNVSQNIATTSNMTTPFHSHQTSQQSQQQYQPISTKTHYTPSIMSNNINPSNNNNNNQIKTSAATINIQPQQKTRQTSDSNSSSSMQSKQQSISTPPVGFNAQPIDQQINSFTKLSATVTLNRLGNPNVILPPAQNHNDGKTNNQKQQQGLSSQSNGSFKHQQQQQQHSATATTQQKDLTKPEILSKQLFDKITAAVAASSASGRNPSKPSVNLMQATIESSMSSPLYSAIPSALTAPTTQQQQQHLNQNSISQANHQTSSQLSNGSMSLESYKQTLEAYKHMMHMLNLAKEERLNPGVQQQQQHGGSSRSGGGGGSSTGSSVIVDSSQLSQQQQQQFQPNKSVTSSTSSVHLTSYHRKNGSSIPSIGFESTSTSTMPLPPSMQVHSNTLKPQLSSSQQSNNHHNMSLNLNLLHGLQKSAGSASVLGGSPKAGSGSSSSHLSNTNSASKKSLVNQSHTSAAGSSTSAVAANTSYQQININNNTQNAVPKKKTAAELHAAVMEHLSKCEQQQVQLQQQQMQHQQQQQQQSGQSSQSHSSIYRPEIHQIISGTNGVQYQHAGSIAAAQTGIKNQNNSAGEQQQSSSTAMSSASYLKQLKLNNLLKVNSNLPIMQASGASSAALGSSSTHHPITNHNNSNSIHFHSSEGDFQTLSASSNLSLNSNHGMHMPGTTTATTTTLADMNFKRTPSSSIPSDHPSSTLSQSRQNGSSQQQQQQQQQQNQQVSTSLFHLNLQKAKQIAGNNGSTINSAKSVNQQAGISTSSIQATSGSASKNESYQQQQQHPLHSAKVGLAAASQLNGFGGQVSNSKQQQNQKLIVNEPNNLPLPFANTSTRNSSSKLGVQSQHQQQQSQHSFPQNQQNITAGMQLSLLQSQSQSQAHTFSQQNSAQQLKGPIKSLPSTSATITVFAMTPKTSNNNGVSKGFEGKQHTGMVTTATGLAVGGSGKVSAPPTFSSSSGRGCGSSSTTQLISQQSHLPQNLAIMHSTYHKTSDTTYLADYKKSLNNYVDFATNVKHPFIFEEVQQDDTKQLAAKVKKENEEVENANRNLEAKLQEKPTQFNEGFSEWKQNMARKFESAGIYFD